MISYPVITLDTNIHGIPYSLAYGYLFSILVGISPSFRPLHERPHLLRSRGSLDQLVDGLPGLNVFP